MPDQKRSLQSTRDAMLARSERLATEEPNFARFLAYAVNATDAEDLAAYTPERMELYLRESYGRIGQRDPVQHKIHFWRPLGDDSPEIIEVFSPDMPFLVDSVLAAIRAKGGTVRLLSHPVLPVDRDSYRVLEMPAGNGAMLESMLHIHIDPIPTLEMRVAIEQEIIDALGDVSVAVLGWQRMLERLRNVIAEFEARQLRGVQQGAMTEAIQFLHRLADHNFTFLGMREYAVARGAGVLSLAPVPGTGLGILENLDFRFLRSGADWVEMTPQHAAFLTDADPLLITKANVRSRVHRRAHMDYVGVKLYASDGSVLGELRILGLFTSMALATPHSEVPIIRRKVAEVMRRSGLPPSSHAGKALMNALDSYPRDELFQIGDSQLFEFATLIANLADRPRVRVLSRIDRFDNFVSILVYLPRERYNSDVRARIGAHLAAAYDGRVSAYYPHFPEGDLVRVHFIIGRDGGRTPDPPRRELEAEIEALTRTFGDLILAAAQDVEVVIGWRDAFPASYEAKNTATTAILDVATFMTLTDEAALAVRLGPGSDEGTLSLRFYHRARPIPLSDRVPMLENFGFRVIDEDTHEIVPADGTQFFLHDMHIAPISGAKVDLAALAPKVEGGILAVWAGAAESDGFNQLTLAAGLVWSDVTILRALSRYLRQIGISFSQAYLATVLTKYPDVATALVAMFHALHDPGFPGARERASEVGRQILTRALDRITSIDEDRIVRRLLNLVDASLRTNAYQRDAEDARRPALAIKFECAAIDGLPEPKPYREIFVYSPRVEGLHLRFGPIARGGIRWSDRPEDFRTEVLGLVKAQQVKNAIIVPVGAKGAFVPKLTPKGATREVIAAEGVAAYTIFISSLLDVTDNLNGDMIIPPPEVRRRDGDDPYLVVAADKGTATFSDTANAIALTRGFWLGDAFASGGSVGYDHKKMGITARGAWEAVKRHFRELDRDIQKEPFSAVGVGDMSGDVFGNGMLLSRQTRLIAAFDHRDIFIDPDPDVTASHAERSRLFALPRSSWQDYDKSKLSRGGGIYSRAEKSVPLSPEARTALGLGTNDLTPVEVMRTILVADVDLLFFGGIGTYIRASSETDAQAGDKANDAVRITGADVRAKAIGEGANLGMTQRGRVEYALRGGKLNTDAIDNSAGVNSSDLEVNIKIALGSLVRAGELDEKARVAFLSKMTNEVAALCLRNNYLQSLAISLAVRDGLGALPSHVSLMEALEARGLLSRDVEFLPSNVALAARADTGFALTRPELAVLLAYAKNTLEADLLDSPVLDDLYLGRELYRYFPETLAETYPDSITNHRLRREVIATVLANAMLNRGGPSFVDDMVRTTSADAGQVASAYAAARDVYGLVDLNAAIDTLDGKVAGAVQLELYAEVRNLLVKETLWFLRNTTSTEGLGALVERYHEGVSAVRQLMSRLLPEAAATEIAARTKAYAGAGVSPALAATLAQLHMLSFATDIVLVVQRTRASVSEASEAFFGIMELFSLGKIVEAGEQLVLGDRFDRMALDRALANLTRAQRDLTADVLAVSKTSVAERLATWREAHGAAVDRATAAVSALTEGELTVSRLTVAAGLLSDLALSA